MVLEYGLPSLGACFIPGKDDNDGRNPYLRVLLGRANETKSVKPVPSERSVPSPAHTVPQHGTRAGPVLLHLLQPILGCAPPYRNTENERKMGHFLLTLINLAVISTP